MGSINDLFTAENKRLFNLLFRHQLYLEGVKSNFAGNYRAVLDEIYAALGKYLIRYRYQQLDQFTKGEINNFIYSLTQEQQRFYSIYTASMLKLLEQLVSSDVKVTQQIFKDVTNKTVDQVMQTLPAKITKQVYDSLPEVFQSDYQQSGDAYTLTDEAKAQQNAEPVNGALALQDNPQGNALIWQKANDEPIPASGLFLKQSLDNFGNYAIATIAAMLRQGYANGWTVDELISKVRGTKQLNYNDGITTKFYAQNSSLVNTLIQHVSSLVQETIASAYFKYYEWVAILDSRTTVICRSRNGTIYVYGEGPLPPAHYNCRSKAVPRPNDQPFENIPQTYQAWLKEQPAEFQNDILGASKAARFRDGSLSITNIGTVQPISLADFVKKIKYILED